MVVTRRAPAPVPASRTNSAQPIPKVKGNARLQTTPDASSPLANGTGGEGLSKSEDSLEEVCHVPGSAMTLCSQGFSSSA